MCAAQNTAYHATRPLRPLARLGLLSALLLAPSSVAATSPGVQAPAQAAAVPSAPAIAADAPAQQIFDEVNELLNERYGGLSPVNRPALTREYQQRLNAVCTPQPRTCPEDKAYPVLEAELTALGDEHSFFQTPEDYQDFVTSATGAAASSSGSSSPSSMVRTDSSSKWCRREPLRAPGCGAGTC